MLIGLKAILATENNLLVIKIHNSDHKIINCVYLKDLLVFILFIHDINTTSLLELILFADDTDIYILTQI